MTNHCEEMFSKSVNACPHLWYLKLQVNQLAHKPMPADYIVLSRSMRYLVECKEVDLTRTHKKFEFARLTQENDLRIFQDKFDANAAFVLILIWRGRFAKSSAFMIPLDGYLKWKEIIGKKSMNENDMESSFGTYKKTLDPKGFMYMEDLK